MTIRVRESLMRNLPELRYEPTEKRVRATLEGRTVIDSRRAVLVWEPRRVVPSYAVPIDDVLVAVDDAPTTGPTEIDSGRGEGFAIPDVSDLPVLDPRIPFAVHTARGAAVEIRSGDSTADGFRIDDPALAGCVLLDWNGFDAWYDEDQEVFAHPRDPFHRMDVLPSSRSVRLEVDGTVIAESTRPHLVFETMLPTRFYLPREDVTVGLHPSELVTYCAYKGRAAYLSPDVDSPVATDLAWTYENPLHDADEVRGMIAFFTERIDLFVDGRAVDRPVTGW